MEISKELCDKLNLDERLLNAYRTAFMKLTREQRHKVAQEIQDPLAMALLLNDWSDIILHGIPKIEKIVQQDSGGKLDPDMENLWRDSSWPDGFRKKFNHLI